MFEMCCAWVGLPLPVGLVLFVGVLEGDVHRFVVSLPGGLYTYPTHPPSDFLGFARVRGRFPVCSAVSKCACVLFMRWGGEASIRPLCADMHAHLFAAHALLVGVCMSGGTCVSVSSSACTSACAGSCTSACAHSFYNGETFCVLLCHDVCLYNSYSCMGDLILQVRVHSGAVEWTHPGDLKGFFVSECSSTYSCVPYSMSVSPLAVSGCFS
jgi:hypothetical protein